MKEKKKKLPTRTIFKRLLKISFEHNGLTVAVFVFSLLFITSKLLIPLIVGEAVNDFMESARNQQYDFMIFIIWAGLIFLSSLFGNIAMFFAGLFSAKLRMSILASLREKFHWIILKLSFSYHGKANTGALITRETRDAERVGGFFGDFVIRAVNMFLITSGCVILIFITDTMLGLIVLGFHVVTLALVFKFAVKLRKYWKSVDDSYDMVTMTVQENVAGVRVVKAFAQGGNQEILFNKRIGRFLKKLLMGIEYLALRVSTARSFFLIAMPTVIYFGGVRVINGDLQLGALTAIILYIGHIMDQFWMIGQIVDIFQNAIASADRIFDVLDENSYLEMAENHEQINTENSDLVFENVCFEYEKDTPVLTDINLEIKGGETVGIIGRTGSGKSTLVHLLPRLFDATQGRILYGGCELKNLDIEELRREIALVFQDTFLFSQTIAENISFGRSDALREEVIEAAKLAEAHNFISELEKGYDTLIGERGVNLSGGQKQRVSIARALLTKPRILIFDDATASVDAGTEENLQNSINHISAKCTKIIISQRISSVMCADKIVVLEDGKIIESGTHQELIERPGLYKEIYQNQFALETAS